MTNQNAPHDGTSVTVTRCPDKRDFHVEVKAGLRDSLGSFEGQLPEPQGPGGVELIGLGFRESSLRSYG